MVTSLRETQREAVAGTEYLVSRAAEPSGHVGEQRAVHACCPGRIPGLTDPERSLITALDSHVVIVAELTAINLAEFLIKLYLGTGIACFAGHFRDTESHAKGLLMVGSQQPRGAGREIFQHATSGSRVSTMACFPGNKVRSEERRVGEECR